MLDGHIQCLIEDGSTHQSREESFKKSTGHSSIQIQKADIYDININRRTYCDSI